LGCAPPPPPPIAAAKDVGFAFGTTVGAGFGAACLCCCCCGGGRVCRAGAAAGGAITGWRFHGFAGAAAGAGACC